MCDDLKFTTICIESRSCQQSLLSFPQNSCDCSCPKICICCCSGDESRTEVKTTNDNSSHPSTSQPSIRPVVVIPNEFQTPRTNRFTAHVQGVKSQPLPRQKTMSPSKHGFHPRSFSPTYKMLIETKEALTEMVEYELYRWRKLLRTAHGSKENELLRRYASGVRSRHQREMERLYR